MKQTQGIWIPIQILQDTRLSSADKLILSLIISLDQSEDGCWAGNRFLAETCGCSESTISNSITRLIKYQYLIRRHFDGRKRYLRCCVPELKRQTHGKSRAASRKGDANNINNNNDLNKDNMSRNNNTDRSETFHAMERPPISHEDFMKELAGRNGNLI